MIAKYPHLKAFIDKYYSGVQNNSKDIRWTLTELHMVIQEIYALSSVDIDTQELKKMISELTAELKNLSIDIDSDGGSFK